MDQRTWESVAQEPDANPVTNRSDRVIRELLRREYLTRADWEVALRDFAQMGKQALGARECMVALYTPERGTWTAWTSAGQRVGDESIALYGSRSVLDEVRKSGEPMLTSMEQPLAISSDSLFEHQVQSVLAVPIFFWDVREAPRERTFGGCLYAHRSSPQIPFTREDVELVRDLTELAQRTLNLLSYVEDVQADLQATEAEVKQLRKSAENKFRLGRYETRDRWFAEHVLDPLRRIAYAARVSLLILGPTGSGKSYLAQAYHYECPRRKKPFVVLDCSQIVSAETLGPELFGYARDSGYANAPRAGMRGKAELADGGTLFIDEISTLPPVLQQKLLRLIQTGCFSPLGSSEERKVDLQIIAATNENLAQLVREGRFREDLYQRLREMTVELPPLDERRADIPELALGFLRAAAERFGRKDVQGFTQKALDRLVAHDWSSEGNIRGLEFTVHRSVLLVPRRTRLLDAQHLDFGRRERPERESVAPEPLEPAAEPSDAAAAKAPLPPKRPPSGAGGLSAEALRELLARKIRQHRAKLADIAADPKVRSVFGSGSRPVPISSLRVRLRNLDLEGLVEQERKSRQTRLDPHELRRLLLEHGSATAVAAHLGMTRDSLMWHMRKIGLRIRDLLAEER